MLIKGIEHFVTLMIGDLENDDVQEFNFSDFDAFNEFVRKGQGDQQYGFGPYFYTLVESINGNPSTFYWTKEIEFVPFTKEQIAEEIAAQEEFLNELTTYGNDMESYMKGIHYTEPDDHYEQKTERLKEFAYVCPFCIREIEDCRCKLYPYYLMQVDRLILPIIRELNMKGYKTTGCCAGHPKENDPTSAMVYICFDKAYEFDEPLPEGAVWSKIKNCVEFEPDCSNYEDLLHFQKECLDKLSDWVEMLFALEDEE